MKRTGARVVHAHNTAPTFGWRALQAAREAGARVVLHLHNYRLVCAVGTCFTHGEDCTRCHGRNTLPGVRLNCRGGSRAEAAAYAAGLALWQKRLAGAADAIVVPSAFALARLRELDAPLGPNVHVLGSVQRTFAERSAAADGEYVLAAGRLTAEKGFADAIDACARAGLPLAIAGDGPERAALEARAAGNARFVGQVTPQELAALRAKAAVAVVPSRYQEILPLAALEAMAAGAADRRRAVRGARGGGAGGGALRAERHRRASPRRSRALWRNAPAGDRALHAARTRWAPDVIARALGEIYGATSTRQTVIKRA